MRSWKARQVGGATVAIVGRPNVGKSTLVNRIVGRKDAIVQEMPGVTRDRSFHPAEWLGNHFTVIDTGGWTPNWSPERTRMDALISAQAEESLTEADLVLFIMDASVGITADDEAVANWLRTAGAPVRLVLNKADHVKELERGAVLAEAWGLGLGEPYLMSALHGSGSGDLLDMVVAELNASGAFDRPTEDAFAIPGIALIGRPNVGKSSLFNYMVGHDRVIVDDVPGTTRDPVDTLIEVDGADGPRTWRLIDTAGLRKNVGALDQTEFYSTVRTRRQLERASVACLLFDASEPIGQQEQKLAREIADSGRAVVLVPNKWDLVSEDQQQEMLRERERLLNFLHYAPMRRISALSGRGINRLFDDIALAERNWQQRIPTARLNAWLTDAITATPPPLGQNHRPLKIRYITQVSAAPPTFRLFCNQRPSDQYVRYLERKLRETFDFTGTPIRMKVVIKQRDKQ